MSLKTIIMYCCLISVIIIRADEVGDRCLSNGENGVCVLISDCEVAISAITKKHYHHLRRCGFQGITEIVCCPHSSDITTTPVYRPTLGRRDGVQSLRIADRECKKLVDTISPPSGVYILGGEIAAEGEFPHMVALGYIISEAYVFRCGGSLISDRYVLTAVHCVNTIDRIQPSMVRIGVVNITGNNWNDATDIEVERIYVHPDYARPRKYHDLALLRLAKRVPYSRNVFPACLYTGEADPTIPLTVTGWGITDVTRAATSSLLLKATLNIVPQESCNLKYSKSRKLPNGIVNEQLCAGDLSGVMDTCQGDSGGPLQGLTGLDGHYRLVGVTSFGSGCGSPVPGVYTRVSKYLDWIESTVWSTA